MQPSHFSMAMSGPAGARIRIALAMILAGLVAGIAARSETTLANGGSWSVGEALDSANGQCQMHQLPQER